MSVAIEITKEESDMFESLVDWIRRDEGSVHPSLHLSRCTHSNRRGIFAKERICKGEALIYLPSRLALSGKVMPPLLEKMERPASPWLRCISSLFHARKAAQNSSVSEQANDSGTNFKPYLDSLPYEYDSVLNWPDEEISSYLAGTTLGQTLQADRKEQTLKRRYDFAVRPYLQATNAIGDTSNGFEDFLDACMCLSTRGFHHKNQTETVTNDDTESYDGPFLLPLIDLLNHDVQNKCTTLQRDPNNGSFFMVAEKDIEGGQEICHSYGDELTSGQLLQTFGFVSRLATQHAKDGTVSTAMTPAILSREQITEACGSIAITYAPKLKCDMNTNRIPDETWDVPSLDEMRDRDFSSLVSDNVAISCSETPLTDELVTLCCLLFLPQDVYDDFVANDPALLDRNEILQDYFLGKLLCKALLVLIEGRLREYGAIVCPATNSLPLQGSDVKDKDILAYLLSKKELDRSQQRALYGITVRLEEKSSLLALRKEVLRIADSMDDFRDDNFTVKDQDESTSDRAFDENCSKKAKTS